MTRSKGARHGLRVCMLLMLSWAAGAGAQAATSVQPMEGQVDYRLAEDAEFKRLPGPLYLPSTAYVRTGDDGLASIQYADGTHITVKPGSVVQVGGQQEGLWVSLGAVLVRAARLLDDEDADRQVRTPVAVAAVRGTEFGVQVQPEGLTRVYVYDGKVAVRNVQLPDEVLVTEGRMTMVAPMRPPTAPAPFLPGDFDGPGGTGALERAEDPVLESTEEPAVDSWLAFADPDIDAQRNPAFAAAVRRTRSTTLMTAGWLHSRDWIDEGAGRRDAEHVEGNVLLAQHVSLLPLGTAGTAGLALEAARSHDDAIALRHAPFQLQGERRRQVTDLRIGRAQALWGGRLAGHDIGVGVGYRHSTTEAEDRLLDPVVSPAERSDETTHLGRLQVGWTGGSENRALSLAWTHDLTSTSATAGPLERSSDGHVDVGEALYRRSGGDWSTAALLRLEWSRIDEAVSDGGADVYDEALRVWAVRLGGGIGLTPTPDLVVGGDLVAGFSQEEAKQTLPAGAGIREDEDDRLLAVNAHLGVQYFARPWLVLTADVTHLLEWQDKTFDILPGTVDAVRRQESSSSTTTTAITGVGWVHGDWRLEYFVRSGVGTRPLSHNLLLVRAVP